MKMIDVLIVLEILSIFFSVGALIGPVGRTDDAPIHHWEADTLPFLSSSTPTVSL